MNLRAAGEEPGSPEKKAKSKKKAREADLALGGPAPLVGPSLLERDAHCMSGVSPSTGPPRGTPTQAGGSCQSVSS